MPAGTPTSPAVAIRASAGRRSVHPVAVFDLDGTLSDPLEGIGRSINHALARHGYAERPLHALADCIGPPLDESFPLLTGSSDAAHVRALAASYRERYADIGFAENTLYDGVPEMLDSLRDSGGDIGMRKWQQLAALRTQGRVDGDAVMVGDRAIDIDAARRNGLHACGVTWGFGSLDELKSAAPRYLCTKPSAIVERLTIRADT